MDSQIEIKRETEFYQGFIRLKMSVSNKTSFVITEITLDFIFEDDLFQIDHYEPTDYKIKNSKVLIGNINAGTSKSIAVYFDPLMCTGSAKISCQVNFRDAQGELHSVFMEPKIISVLCPIIKTEFDINVGRLKELIENLPSRGSKIYEIHHGFDINKMASISREVIEKHDVRHVRTLKTKESGECEIWYYGRTKVTRSDIVIKISIFSEKNSLELFVATEYAEALTGLLAELGRDLKDNIERRATGKNNIFNVVIRKSMLQQSNLLDLCSLDGACPVNILVEDSILLHTNLLSRKDENGEEKKAKEEEEKQDRLRKQQEEEIHLRIAEEEKPHREKGEFNQKDTEEQKIQDEPDRNKKEQEKEQQEELRKQREEAEQKQKEEERKIQEKVDLEIMREEEVRKNREERDRRKIKLQEKLRAEIEEKLTASIRYPSNGIDKTVKEIYNSLSEGQITFAVNKKMKVGISENVKANVAKKLSEIDENIAKYYLAKGIKVSPLMSVSLKGDNFDIKEITPEIQVIIDEEITTWEWIIKPLKSGTQKLLLSVDVIIEIPQYSERRYHLPTLEENIEVKVNPAYFLECHWKWIVGTFITVIGIIVTLITSIFAKK